MQHFKDRNMELLEIDANATPIYIPTTDQHGTVTFGKIQAITRHDPGKNSDTAEQIWLRRFFL